MTKSELLTFFTSLRGQRISNIEYVFAYELPNGDRYKVEGPFADDVEGTRLMFSNGACLFIGPDEQGLTLSEHVPEEILHPSPAISEEEWRAKGNLYTSPPPSPKMVDMTTTEIWRAIVPYVIQNAAVYYEKDAVCDVELEFDDEQFLTFAATHAEVVCVCFGDRSIRATQAKRLLGGFPRGE